MGQCISLQLNLWNTLSYLDEHVVQFDENGEATISEFCGRTSNTITIFCASTDVANNKATTMVTDSYIQIFLNILWQHTYCARQDMKVNAQSTNFCPLSNLDCAIAGNLFRLLHRTDEIKPCVILKQVFGAQIHFTSARFSFMPMYNRWRNSPSALEGHYWCHNRAHGKSLYTW